MYPTVIQIWSSTNLMNDKSDVVELQVSSFLFGHVKSLWHVCRGHLTLTFVDVQRGPLSK